MLNWLWTNLDNLLKFGGAASVVLIGIWRFGGKVRLKWRNLMTLLALADRISSQLADIKKELTPNGGGSLKDQVSRIEQGQILTELHAKALLDQSSAPTFRCDARGHWIWANRALLKLSDMQAEQIYGNGWINLVIASEREDVHCEWISAVEQGRDFSMTFTIQTAGKPPARVYGQASILRNGASVVGYLGSLSPA
jgi:PAS domain-containing protein